MTFKVAPAEAASLMFAPLSKNFAHFPLCRHLAATPPWRISSGGSRLLCELHQNKTGKSTILLSMPKSLAKHHPELIRAPSRFDVDLLLRLTAISKIAEKSAIYLEAAEAGALAINAEHGNRQAHRRRMRASKGKGEVTGFKSSIQFDKRWLDVHRSTFEYEDYMRNESFSSLNPIFPS